MNATTLQRMIDQLIETSRQQWLLRVAIVIAPLAALAGVAAEIGRWWPFGVLVVFFGAFACAFQPDEHTAVALVIVIVLHWVVTVDDLETVWLPVVAVCLLIFHTLVALAATVPIGGTLPVSTLGRWAARTTLVGAATFLLWGVVMVFEARDPAGNGVLTGIALAAIAGATLALRALSQPSPR